MEKPNDQRPLNIFTNSVYACHHFLPSSGPSGTFGCFCLNLLFEWVFEFFYVVPEV